MSAERLEHHFSIVSTFTDVAELAERAGQLCAGRPGGSDLSDSLRLCLAEALNNVVEHAYRGDGTGQIDIQLAVGDGGFEVTITDTGLPMPGNALPKGEVDLDHLDLDQLPEGGFGWMLIRNEVDHLDYQRRDNCNVLSLRKRTHA